jgi:abortive infection bacteriophage resistance protein
MPYTKPYLTVPDQLALMKRRGMGVSDDALAQSYLQKIGYYRLSGYSYPYRQSSTGADGKVTVADRFKPGATLAEIVELYVFDKRLRMLVWDAIERIEIALRVHIALILGAYSPTAHRDVRFLHPNFTRRIDPNTGLTYHAEWVRRHDDAFAKSKEEFAKHFKRRYPGEYPPIWIGAEVWDFGAMSFLFSGMRKVDQTAVSSIFSVPSFQIMETWLRSLNVTRNICAHHSRLWNRASAVQPRWPTKAQCPELGHIEGKTHSLTRLYGTLCICAHFLKIVSPSSGWRDRVKTLIKEFPQSKIVSLQSAGFPKGWEKEALWN